MQGHWWEAKNSFERVRGLLISLPEYMVQVELKLATCYEKLGNSDLQMQAIHRARTTDPSYAPAIIAEMNALMATGHIDEAMQRQNELAQRGSVGPGNAVVFARMLMFKTLRQPAAKRDWAAVEQSIDAAEKATPNSPEIVLLRGQMLTCAKPRPRGRDPAAGSERQKSQGSRLLDVAYLLGLARKELGKSGEALG